MEDGGLRQLIAKHLGFLMEEYGFSVAKVMYCPEFMGNAEVILHSQRTGLRIVVDRGQVLVNIGPSSRPAEDWFELTDVVKFFAPEVQTIYAFQNEPQEANVSLESQLAYLAGVMSRHCRLVLAGDFSMQEDIRKIETQRVQATLDSLRGLSPKRDPE